MFRHSHAHTNADYVLVGAGIMSATLGALLKQLEPDATIEIFETLDRVPVKVLRHGTMPGPATLGSAA